MVCMTGGACPGLASSNPGLQKMVYGAFGLPFGLLLVLLCGAELFTGNTALITAAARALSPDVVIAIKRSAQHRGHACQGSAAHLACMLKSLPGCRNSSTGPQLCSALAPPTTTAFYCERCRLHVCAHHVYHRSRVSSLEWMLLGVASVLEVA